MIPHRQEVIARIKALPPLWEQEVPWWAHVLMWLEDRLDGIMNLIVRP